MANAMPSAADFQAADLYDPGAPDAADRLALLTWLSDHGISITQMVAVTGAGASILTLAGDLAIRPGDRMTLAETAKRAGGAWTRVDPGVCTEPSARAGNG